MTAVDEGVISNDFFQGDVRAGIERVRRRLLDLTNRNRLFNFKYPRRSRSVLRIVDELPNQLCESLLNAADLLFDPVRKPTRRELDEWRNDKIARLKLKYGDRFEEMVDLRTEALAEPSVEEFARRLGIPTEYELPRVPGGGATPERHQDARIQTLLFPDDLERTLSNIQSKARLAIEETGTNMLYLALGFLEWYESDASDQAHLAPLFLVPVELKKGQFDPSTGVYRYTLAYSGEDLVTNVSLQEKLRVDFSLGLPELEEEELPEAYWQRVGTVASRRDRWRIRRHATLCLLSFGKLLMYLDLDSDRWPGGLDNRPRVRDFFVGVERGDDVAAEEYDIDDLPDAPGLIDDADSSQHSALVDALQGRNLVIEGPPGTGKSQTITNLVAASLAETKSVLFVSEKLAALEVVKKRLEEAGLGVYCLELHSHKTRKREFLSDLENRLAVRGRLAPPSEYHRLQQQLERYRAQLNRYAQLIDRPMGRLGRSVHDVLWAAKLRLRSLGEYGVELTDLFEPDAPELDHLGLDRESRSLQTLADACTRIIEEFGAVEAHPWSAVTNSRLTFVDRPRVVGAIRSLQASCDDVELQRGLTLHELRSFIQAAGQVESCPTHVPARALAELRTVAGRDAASTLLRRITCIQELRAAVSKQAPRAADKPHDWSERLATGVRLVRRIRGSAETFDWVRKELADLASSTRVVLAAAELLDVIREALPGVLGDDTIQSARMAALTRDILSKVPIDHLWLRSGSNCDPTALPIIESVRSQQKALVADRETLGVSFDLDTLPPPSVLRNDARILGTAGYLGWLHKEVRLARRRFRTAQRRPTKRSVVEMAQSLNALARFLEQQRSFAEHPALKTIAKDHAAGLDTPLDEIATVAEWHRGVQIAIAGMAGLRHPLVGALLEADMQVLEILKIRTESYPTLATLNEALEAAARLREIPTGSSDSIREVIQELEELGNQGNHTLAWADELGLPGAWGLDELEGLQETVANLAALLDEMSTDETGVAVAGELYTGSDTEPRLLKDGLAYSQFIAGLELPSAIGDRLLSQENGIEVQRLEREVTTLSRQVNALEHALAKVDTIAALDWERVSSGEEEDDGLAPDEISIPLLAKWCTSALAHDPAFDSWASLLNARRLLQCRSAQQLAELLLSGSIPTQSLSTAFELTVFETLARHAFAEHPDLVQFRGLDHDRLRQEFQRVDQLLIHAHRNKVAALLDDRSVPLGNGTGPVRTYTELSLIEHEISKQRRHVPIRQLVRRAGRALQALKPCFMMGPLSVAQYLEPAGLEFDVIVMDEASQIKPEDALGAVARGAQLVIVGDPKQLPPTSFFERMDEEENEEEELAEGMLEAESILDVASSAYRPTRMLRWHYRSRHQSLVAFSNKQFYREGLIVFPSATVESRDLGVKFHRVRGRYEARVRRNVPEAAAVVEFIVKHMRERPDESMGVATMNTSQRDVIQDEFEQRLKSEPLAESFVAKWRESLEPFFVKNLENVQGDERDVIIVSVTYGPDESGRIYQRFGPLNGPTGHRRLNVLVTRAKKRVEVFSSMSADEIRITEQTAAGVVALKHYLAYAENGVLEQARLTGREPDSDFEIEVASALRWHGLEIVAQVGVAGYFVDLAVRHPRAPGRFILGIECDGATYHSGRSARDRDRLRQQVLEDQGWTIHRVWSTDWFRDPARETDRIVDLVKDLEAQYEREPLEEVQVVDSSKVVREHIQAGGDHGRSTADVEAVSETDARRELAKLEDTLAETFPSVPREQSMLREEMVEALIRGRPTTRDEWLGCVPLELRLDTAPEHMVVLDDILHILSKMVRG